MPVSGRSARRLSRKIVGWAMETHLRTELAPRRSTWRSGQRHVREFFRTLECELLNRQSFKTQIEARMAVFDFIEGWYNPHRRHSALDYLSPINYQRSHQSQTDFRSPTPSTEAG
jgi:transposase InsO family protein